MQKQKEMEEQKEATKQASKQTTGQPSSDNTYEIEEGYYYINFYYIVGEDTFANMKEIMGFGSFSSTKVIVMNWYYEQGQHVSDNDNLVNRGAVRKVKQFKAMRILNRKGI